MQDRMDSIVSTARVISNILHPYVILSLLLVYIAYELSTSTSLWAKWAIITLITAYVIPVFYMRVKVAIVAHSSGSQVELRTFFRERPTEMIVLACLFAVPGPLILYLMEFPHSLIVPIVAVGITSLIIALINIIYRASFHLSGITSMAVSAIIILNLQRFAIIPFLSLLGVLGASRYLLGQHTALQLMVGFFTGLIVTLAFYYLIGFMG